MNVPESRKPMVHIVGGGMAGLTAACALSRGDWKKHFSAITVHQQGWRLGGKGASGRRLVQWDPKDGTDKIRTHRIEEHGLHVWFGYYENSFRMLRDCHLELDEIARSGGQPRWSPGYTDVAQGFRPISDITVMEDESGTWTPWTACFPTDDRLPWDRDLATEPDDWHVGWALRQLVGQLSPLLQTLLASAASLGERRPTFDLITDDEMSSGATAALAVAHRRLDPFIQMLLEPVERVLDGVATALERHEELTFSILESALAAISRLSDALRLRLVPEFEASPEVRRLTVSLDLALTISRGLLRHRVVEDTDLDLLDEWDLREWLEMQGALDTTVNSSVVRCLSYDLPFAYRDGDRRKQDAAAGSAIRLLFRTFFTYRGAIMWKMNGAMGDVVVAPLFELLVKRGVRFEFFHQLARVVVDDDRVTELQFRDQPGGRHVDLPEEERIAAMKRFLVDCQVAPLTAMCATADSTNLSCWPAEPVDWSGGRSSCEELEQWPFTPRDDASCSVPIADRDVVVYAMPVATIGFVFDDKVSTPGVTRWRLAGQHVKTVATMAEQLWLRHGVERFGFRRDAIACGFSEPLDTFSDMPDLEHHEGFPCGGTVLYLCSVLPDLLEVDLDGQRRESLDGSRPKTFQFPDVTLDESRWRDAVRKKADTLFERFDTSMASVWWNDGATDDRWLDKCLLGTHCYEGRHEVSRYRRLNIDPSERYTLSVKGSSKYRLGAGDTSIENLVPAGDWTRCVLNAGCVEAATISGLLAAEAVMGRVRGQIDVPIIGRPRIDIEIG